MIDIKCESKDYISINDLTEFQGELKNREESDILKIVKSIKKHGFCFPFFIWKHDGINHVFDGHGRLLALKWLQSQGEEIPALPCVYVNCKNEDEAKELLLKLNSNYGKMTQESVIEFLDGIHIDFEEIALPFGELDFITEDDVDNFDYPELQSGDKTTACTMTFTLSQEQVEIVKRAIEKCGKVSDEENLNSNGNAIAQICKEFLIGRH